VGSETLTYTGATTNSQNVVTGNFISAITLGNGSNGGLASNYQLPTLNSVNSPASITAKGLTVTGTSVANKAYDGTTAATLSGGSLQGVVSGDSVTLVEAGQFSDKNVGTGKSVTAANTLSGSGAANYSITQPTGLSANITAKGLTVTGTLVANKVYDGTTAATLSGGSLQGVVSGDSVTLVEAGQFSDKNVGIGKSVTAANTLSGSGAANYSITQPTGLSADITIAYGSGIDQVQSTLQNTLNQAPVANAATLPKESSERTGAQGLRTSVSNVVSPPARIETSLGRGDNLLLVSTPRAQETTVLVTLADAKNMLAPAGAASTSGSVTGAASASVSEVRVPISRDSIADIVNGGVKLPQGVEQQLFVVKN
jgi:membrane-bound inhibitor of C-type lysozyme